MQQNAAVLQRLLLSEGGYCMMKKKAAKLGIEQVLGDLETYCAVDCQTRACGGCPINAAKRNLSTIKLEEYMPDLKKPLTIDQKLGLHEPFRAFSIIQGGAK
jgi:hypothetical protein